MRAGILILVLAWVSTSNMCGLSQANATKARTYNAASATTPSSDSLPIGNQVILMSSSPKIDFTTQVKPILQSRCQPCHFSGGVMYQRLPFDQPKTIHTLGEKMFTRIKDENDRRVIREFLAQ